MKKGSPEHIYQHCARKIAHMSLETAQKEAKSLRKQTGKPMGAYRCRYCHYYHVGRSRKPSNLRRWLRLKALTPKPN